MPLTADFWHRHQREPSTGVNHWGQRFSSVGDQVRSDTASRSTSSARCRALKLMVPDLFYPGRRLLFGSTNWIDGTIFQDFARPTVSEKTEDRHRGERTVAFAGLVEKYAATLPGNTVSESSQPEGARTENERVTEVERRRPLGGESRGGGGKGQVDGPSYPVEQCRWKRASFLPWVECAIQGKKGSSTGLLVVVCNCRAPGSMSSGHLY